MSEDKKRFVGPVRPNWCPGCGDYGLLSATTRVLAAEGYQPNEVVIISGIGCSSSFPHWTTAYGMHVLHGRALPAATGVHLANPTLKTLVVGGDGDGLAIGMGHFVHAARRNLDITYMIMNNQIYGLTLGQASPTSQIGHLTRTTPLGVDETPINPISLAISSGASFVARGFAGNGKHLRDLITQALNHKGFSFIDVISPCVTFNRLNTYDWFRERVYELDNSHDPSDIIQAYTKAVEWGNNIPIGVIYKQAESIPLHTLDAVTRSRVPVNEPLGFKAQGIDTKAIFDEFR